MRAVIFAVILGGLLIPGLLDPGEARAEPPTTHEVLDKGTSGFWTSNKPAVGGSYRYKLLGIGGALVLVTGLLTYRTLRKANAERAARS